MNFKPGFIIPVYRHGSTIEGVVNSLLHFAFPIIIIDDGNDEQNKAQILECAEKYPLVSLVSYSKNAGKGLAMSRGVKKALEMGLSHVFQIDADGQHDCGACQSFLELSQKHPEALINGYPEYDTSAPANRINGRKLSIFWTGIVSLNFSPADVLCGFRIYPLKPYARLLRRHALIHRRMGYDSDILVHYLWMGVPLFNLPVKVSYPKDGISNFHIIKDNIAISLTFSRLFFGMILRLPKLIYFALKRKFNGKPDDK